MNKYNPLDKARELGKAILQSDEYLSLRKAEEDFHNDKDAARLLNELKMTEEKYNNLIHKEMNEHDLSPIKNQIILVQDKIKHNLAIQNLYEAQKNYDNLIKNINNIIDYITGKEQKNCSSNKCDSCSCSKK